MILMGLKPLAGLAPLLLLCACEGFIGDKGGGGLGASPKGVVAAQTMHRLNRTEYRNTVRDLLGTQADPASNFPADDVSLGFDNIAQVLTVSPLHLELYEQAAQELAKEALAPNGSARARILPCDPTGIGCREPALADLAYRAWRRPVARAELDGLLGLVNVALDEGGGVEMGMELALRAILLSPHFIYRPELEQDSGANSAHPLGDYEIASRLSYFLWSSMPDDALLAAAEAGELQDDAQLAAQVKRMLADPKAAALVDNFAGQWLRLRAFSEHQPDYEAFPDWDDGLRNAMRRETELFFSEFLKGNAPLDALLTADFTFLNQRLAEHYGLPFSGGQELQRVSLSDSGERRGLLTQGSLLTVTSTPTRTSPVKRGVWVLEELLCDGPPAPPPGVEGLVEDGSFGGSLREQLEEHRSNPACSGCHSVMDPIGLGLENYDGVGGFRVDDNGNPIDPSGELLNSGSFSGVTELADLLQEDPRLSHCVIEKLLTYALGREIVEDEHPFIEEIAEQLVLSGNSLPGLIELLVLSEPFRTRRGSKEGS